MPDDEKRYTQEELDAAITADRAKREGPKYTEEELSTAVSAERTKREQQTRWYFGRELTKRVAAAANIPQAEAEDLARPHFDRLIPRDDGGVDVRLMSGGSPPAGSLAPWTGMDLLAREILLARSSATRERDVEAIIEKKRRSAPFRSAML